MRSEPFIEVVHASPGVWGDRAARPWHPAVRTSIGRLRVLFITPYPGYMRYFDGTIEWLEGEGHEVRLAFHDVEKQAEGLVALDRLGERVSVVGRVPKIPREWRPVADAIRGTADYLRYLDPRYAEAFYLRGRAPRPTPRALARWSTTGRRRVAAGLRMLTWAESLLPADGYVEYLKTHAPDLVVVAALAHYTSTDTDVVKAARALRIPTVFTVSSWDNLTNRGVVKVRPERVTVWNDTQRREALELHRLPADKIVVTGAQPFDRWFDRTPSRDRDYFCAEIGLPADLPILLFVGSTASMTPPEAEVAWVRSWVEAIRDADDPRVREAAILVRPHPFNVEHWSAEDLSDQRDVVVWPREGANPVDESSRDDYFDSLHHSAVVVGINTSAMVEAAIVGRPVLTVRATEFRHSQSGTLHFGYLVADDGGIARESRSLVAHIEQVAEILRDPAAARDGLERFVRSFVRPRGVDVPAVPVLGRAIVDAAKLEPEPATWTTRRWRLARALIATAVQRSRTRGRRKPGQRARGQWRAVRRQRRRLERALRFVRPRASLPRDSAAAEEAANRHPLPPERLP